MHLIWLLGNRSFNVGSFMTVDIIQRSWKEGRRKKEEGRRKKEEGEEGGKYVSKVTECFTRNLVSKVSRVKGTN